MITSPTVQFRRGGSPLWLVGAIAFAWVCGVRLQAENTPSETKAYTLFMGMDFDVQQGKDYYRVTDVTGGSFILRVKDELVRVPMNESVGLKITRGLKLAGVSAVINEPKAERTYTPANDPRRKWLAQQDIMMSIADDTKQNAQHSMIVSDREVEAIEIYMRDHPEAAESLKGKLDYAQTQRTTAHLEFDTDTLLANKMTDSGYYMQKMEEELKKELFDAVNVSFEISSPRPLKSPYVVVVVQFRDPNASANTAQNWIHAEAIDRLDQTPMKFRVTRGGFPGGYILEQFQVHVYDRGSELASTVAPKRVELTGEEAHQYLMIEHLAAHKGKEVSATVAIGNLPADLRQQLPSGDYGRTFYAKVSKEGLSEGVFTDEKCTSTLEEGYTATVIRNMRFLPALEKGKPAEGVAKVRLNEIRL